MGELKEHKGKGEMRRKKREREREEVAKRICRMNGTASKG